MWEPSPAQPEVKYLYFKLKPPNHETDPLIILGSNGQVPGPGGLRLNSALRPDVQQKSLIQEMRRVSRGMMALLCVWFLLFLVNSRWQARATPLVGNIYLNKH